MSLLASHEDDVLKIAFTIGDPFADLLNDDHTPFPARARLWRAVAPRAGTNSRHRGRSPNSEDYGHGDYLPSDVDDKWKKVADFMRLTFLRLPSPWPG